MIRVMLVDDHPLVLEGLRAMMDAERDIQVVATTTEGERVPELVRPSPRWSFRSTGSTVVDAQTARRADQIRVSCHRVWRRRVDARVSSTRTASRQTDARATVDALRAAFGRSVPLGAALDAEVERERMGPGSLSDREQVAPARPLEWRRRAQLGVSARP
jgi:hypothetical protein